MSQARAEEMKQEEILKSVETAHKHANDYTIQMLGFLLENRARRDYDNLKNKIYAANKQLEELSTLIEAMKESKDLPSAAQIKKLEDILKDLKQSIYLIDVIPSSDQKKEIAKFHDLQKLYNAASISINKSLTTILLEKLEQACDVINRVYGVDVKKEIDISSRPDLNNLDDENLIKIRDYLTSLHNEINKLRSAEPLPELITTEATSINIQNTLNGLGECQRLIDELSEASSQSLKNSAALIQTRLTAETMKLKAEAPSTTTAPEKQKQPTPKIDTTLPPATSVAPLERKTTERKEEKPRTESKEKQQTINIFADGPLARLTKDHADLWIDPGESKSAWLRNAVQGWHSLRGHQPGMISDIVKATTDSRWKNNNDRMTAITVAITAGKTDKAEEELTAKTNELKKASKTTLSESQAKEEARKHITPRYQLYLLIQDINDKYKPRIAKAEAKEPINVAELKNVKEDMDKELTAGIQAIRQNAQPKETSKASPPPSPKRNRP